MMNMLFLLFATVAFAQNSCYYAADKRAGSLIVPCSSGTEVASCCQSGDLCLADSACWNPQYNVTYLYGCTDSTYTDGACPWKCGPDFDDAPYVGLDYCSNTTARTWSCTHPPSNDPSIAEFSAQQCLDDSIIAFAGPSSLQPILSLPTNAGGSTLYFSQVNPTSYTPVSGYTPSTTPRPTASVPSSVVHVSSATTSDSTNSGGSVSTTGSTGISGATATAPAASAPAASSSGLSTGAKAGIGAGIGGAAIAIAAIVIAWMILRRRRSPRTIKEPEAMAVPYQPTPSEKKPIQTGPSELPLTERPSSGIPSELPDSESHFTSPAPTYTAWSRPQPGQELHELPADNTK